MKLYSPAAIAALLEKHNFKLSKGLGQNFLADQNIIEKIISGSGIGKNDLVIEIGSGLGALTAAAAGRAAKVIGIEIDKKLIPILKDTLNEYENVEIINGDILKEDLNGLVRQNPGNGELIDGAVKIIGNLPYYITTPVIMKILEGKTAADSITVMIQKEVADRLRAKPGTKAYGAITVAINYYCEIKHITDVPKDVFMPKPKVDSSVIRLDIRKEPPVKLDDPDAFFLCVKAGFGQRRKTLLNSLTGISGLDKGGIAVALQKASIDPARRAETLSLAEFGALANCLRLEQLKKRGVVINENN